MLKVLSPAPFLPPTVAQSWVGTSQYAVKILQVSLLVMDSLNSTPYYGNTGSQRLSVILVEVRALLSQGQGSSIFCFLKRQFTTHSLLEVVKQNKLLSGLTKRVKAENC